MPSPSKRPQRSRREPLRKNDVPDSSPSRPAKRRKKIEEPVEDEELVPEVEPLVAPLPIDRSGLTLDDDELVAAVVPFLSLPPFHVQATMDHANTLHEKHFKDGVQAYAKLAGKDWTFYVKQLNNVIGRPPEGAVQENPFSSIDPDNALETSEDGVQINLGPNKIVSRSHANIYFDSITESWNIEVNGRNGIRINNDLIRRGSKLQLISGQVLEIGGVEMMFVLPDSQNPPKIHDKFLARAGLIAENEKHNLPSSPAPVLLVTPPRPQNGVPGAQPIAPAPPNYQRPGTPVGAFSKNPHSTIHQSPAYAGGTIFMNSDDVDLSLDENSLIKPSFSYANMISQAILSSPDEKINLAGIYSYITDRYAYYRHQPPGGWQNSIRHNLSLNKAFVKVPRSTDEPGKGMKWCIVPESRKDMSDSCAKGGRGGHRGSSIPNSPANIESFRVAQDNGAPSSGPRRKRSPPSGSPGFPYTAPQLTPDRRNQLSQSLDDSPGDGSPLPRHKPSRSNFGLSDNLPGSPPPLSSSYMQDESNSFVTPAPHRVHPRLAPPSTAQRPSQVMPTSSPAPFWKYADIGNTPLRINNFIDSSPVKGIAPSSSPPPIRRSSAASPTRNPSPVKIELPIVDEIEEEDGGFDLTRGFQSISSFHAPTGSGVPASSSGPPGRS